MTDLDAVWRASQRALGYRDGVKGKPAYYADQHYQRGHREGVKQRLRPGCQFPRVLSWKASCRYAASKIATSKMRFSSPGAGAGLTWEVCGVHANVLARRGFVISEME
jgi:hypothetical protein